MAQPEMTVSKLTKASEKRIISTSSSNAASRQSWSDGTASQTIVSDAQGQRQRPRSEFVLLLGKQRGKLISGQVANAAAQIGELTLETRHGLLNVRKMFSGTMAQPLSQINQRMIGKS